MFDERNYPIKMSNVLPDRLFESIQDELIDWRLTNQSYNDDDPIFWTQSLNYKNTNIVFREAQTIIKYKLMKVLRRPLNSFRIHTNLATSGQKGSVFHTDDFNPGRLTFVLFANSNWDVQWGGENVVYNPHLEEYCYTTFIPNYGACFPSDWEHYGASPLSHTDEPRVSIAFLYDIM